MAKQEGVEKFIHINNLVCCVILENKLIVDKMVRVRQNFLPSSWQYIDNFDYHTNGRILVCWNPVIIAIQIISANDQMIHMRVTSGSFSFLLSAIYRWHNGKDRKPLWNSLMNSHHQCTEHWLIGGDFNCLAHPNDKINGQRVLLKDTEYFLEQTDYFDHAYTGLHYTWTDRHTQDLIFCKLDSILVNSLRINAFPDSRFEFLSSTILDHSPGIINTSVKTDDPGKNFKMGTFWFAMTEFHDLLLNQWRLSVVLSLSLVANKLKSLKLTIKKKFVSHCWND
uniref:Endonuclease/exonuclease/phosphatase domain-containing protein n=1 Tax=Kalanchoe fedtschenkoi TaxID=63787 RepID=A0A7N0VCU1_KALFE